MRELSMKTKVMAIFIALVMTGCASSPYTYHVEPTPLVAGQSKYMLGDVHVSLIEGHGAPTDNAPYATEEMLTKEFTEALNKYMKELDILAETAAVSDGTVNVDVDFTRTFHISGSALAKPQISHTVIINKAEQPLVSVKQGPYQTKYAYLEDMAVNLEITAGNWDVEDEPRDVDLVSKLISEDISEIGK